MKLWGLRLKGRLDSSNIAKVAQIFGSDFPRGLPCFPPLTQDSGILDEHSSPKEFDESFDI